MQELLQQMQGWQGTIVQGEIQGDAGRTGGNTQVTMMPQVTQPVNGDVVRLLTHAKHALVSWCVHLMWGTSQC